MTAILDEWACLALEVEAERNELLLPEAIERLATHIREALDLALDGLHGHRFEPIGFSLLAFGTDARLAIHTWPEHRFATIDLWIGTPWLQTRASQLTSMLAAAGYRVTGEWLVEPLQAESPPSRVARRR